MCGRYSLAPTPEQRKALEKRADVPPVLNIRFNIAPTQAAYVITNDQPNTLQSMTWGLVPHWSADGKNSGKLINARAEGIDEKPSFREPLRSRRCLVPADSFYEWRHAPGGRKTPYRIMARNGELLYFAGLWDEWTRDGETQHTFTIITTAPNHEMADLHNRMPLILTSREAQERWLSTLPSGETLAMLQPPTDGLLSMYRVSEKLNKTDYDAPDLHIALPETPTLFSGFVDEHE